MVCSNCKRLLMKTGIRYSHITQGNIRTCPQIGGGLYVKPVYSTKITQLNTQHILHISSYLNYFEIQSSYLHISKHFHSIVTTVSKSVRRTIKMKQRIIHTLLYQLNKVPLIFPSFDLKLFLTYNDTYIIINAPDYVTGKNIINYKKTLKELDKLLSL